MSDCAGPGTLNEMEHHTSCFCAMIYVEVASQSNKICLLKHGHGVIGRDSISPPSTSKQLQMAVKEEVVLGGVKRSKTHHVWLKVRGLGVVNEKKVPFILLAVSLAEK